MANDNISARGDVFLEIWHRDGTLIERVEHKNLIVNVGKQALASLLGSGNADKVVNTIGFGTSGISPAGADTSIENPFTKALDGVTYSGTSVNFAYALELAENNGVTIREFALFCDDGTLFSRIIRNPINKTSDIRLSGTWKITF